MPIKNEYYYGQGKVYLAPYNSKSYVQWRWIGDVSSLKLNFEFKEQYSYRSIGGRLVKDKRFLTFTGGNVAAIWFERSIENIELVLMGKQSTRKQSWEQEQLSNIVGGMLVSLKHQNVRSVVIDGLKENSDYLVNYVLGTIYFLTTPKTQFIKIEYDYSASNSIAILNNEHTELMLRYEGINLLNPQTFCVELYRLSLDPVDVISLIDDESKFSNIETVMQLLPDLSKSLSSDFGLFGRIARMSEFELITYNGKINHDGSHDFAY